MRFFSYLRTEFLRLFRSRVTWLALLAASACPLAGYSLFQPAGTGTTAAMVVANPLLTGAIGGAFVFAALALFELDRVRKGQMEPITDSITSPMMMSVVKPVSLMAAAVLSSLITSALYLPYTWVRLGDTFQIGEYFKFVVIFLMPSLGTGVLLASAFYQIFRRGDLSFVCFTATMLAGLGPWSRDTYLLYWIDLSSLGFSGDLGNTSIYRMAFYSRVVWLCLFSGAWVFSLLCVRRNGRQLPGSIVRNLKHVCIPMVAAVLLAGGASLFIHQPYMDHEEPVTLDTTNITGGGMSVSIGGGEEENGNLSLLRTEMDLRIDTRRGVLLGEARYEMQNFGGQPQDCLLEVNPGCTIEDITVNGEAVPFTDLQNDHFMLMKNVSLTLPENQELKVVITYQCRPKIPANTGILSLYYEITPEYVCIGGNHAVPGFQAVNANGSTFFGQVTLPAGMELIALGNTPDIPRENDDGTATWNIGGEGAQPFLFAGNYTRVKIPDTEFPVYFCYSKTHQNEFEELDIETLLSETIAYCTNQYGPLPYTEDYPLNIVMTSAHMMGGGARGNLSYMGETFFTAANLNNPDKGGSAAEVIAHEIIHQWWGTGRFLIDMENTDWSSEALTCYTTYRLMKTLRGEAYAEQFYLDAWREKYDYMMGNFYLRNPEYLPMLPERHQTVVSALIFDADTYAKAPLQILKAERLVGGEENMDRILQGLFQNGGTELPPFVTWQDFLDACGLTEDQLAMEGGGNHD